MRGFTLDGFETRPGRRNDLPVPSTGAGELLVRIHASSVNPADAAIASGCSKAWLNTSFP
jgi:NADPH:quinone reductase-like Zn-dependent oxidoreductase